ncbi:Rpn family recombination-promoting nuclease/putative transposase [Anaerovibrio sp.]|uniref:Rpn family recombination-promoting nuclease/putative transposase n=1 Tax=Anaerovibrio sp. TaxID=1872532 RepID=UPI00388D3819
MATEERHYDPTNDLLFKFVFGNEKRKHITLQFINDVMGLSGNEAFIDLRFKNSELPPEKQGDKLGRLDVYAITNDRQRVDIEMQAIPYSSMPQRTLFYWAHSYLQFDGLNIGEGYDLLRPAININIMRNICLHYDMNKAHSVYRLLEKDTHHCLTKDLEIHFLEVPKYKNKNVKEFSPLECWFAYFANKLSKTEKEELTMLKPVIGDAMDASKRYIMDDKEYWAYLNREAAILDYNTDRRAALAEGYKEGRNEEREATALDMLRDNKPMEEIIKYSHLSEERIKELAKQFK